MKHEFIRISLEFVVSNYDDAIDSARLEEGLRRVGRDYSDGRFDFPAEMMHVGLEAAAKNALYRAGVAPHQWEQKRVLHFTGGNAFRATVKTAECDGSIDGWHHSVVRYEEEICEYCGKATTGELPATNPEAERTP